MRDRLEGIGYYLSCMLLLNVIYALSIIADGDVFSKHCGHYNVAGVATFVIAVLFALLGVVFTAGILFTDDSEKSMVTTGKQFEVKSVKDLTGENYFANFSVIVLTGLALPSNPDGYILAIFLLIEVTLGIVYIKKKMYYMNPVLSLMNYSIFECTGSNPFTGKEYDGTYYFLTRDLNIFNGKVIKYKNINSHVIRLNKKK